MLKKKKIRNMLHRYIKSQIVYMYTCKIKICNEGGGQKYGVIFDLGDAKLLTLFLVPYVIRVEKEVFR